MKQNYDSLIPLITSMKSLNKAIERIRDGVRFEEYVSTVKYAQIPCANNKVQDQYLTQEWVE